MMHDITHCNYDKCPSKDTCYRYQMHLDAVNKKLTFLTYIKHDDNMELPNGKCHLYWNIKH